MKGMNLVLMYSNYSLAMVFLTLYFHVFPGTYICHVTIAYHKLQLHTGPSCSNDITVYS